MRMPSSIATWCLILFFLFYGLSALRHNDPSDYHGTPCPRRRNIYLAWQVKTSLLNNTASQHERLYYFISKSAIISANASAYSQSV